MSSANHISQDDLLLFALQFLPEDEMVAAHEHLSECEDCRRQVSWIQGDLASYAMTAEVQAPPSGARERLMRSVAKEKKQVPAGRTARAERNGTQAAEGELSAPMHDDEPRTPAKIFSMEDAPVRRRMGFAGWAGWAVAAVAIAAAGLQYRQTQVIQSRMAEADAKLGTLTDEYTKASAVLDAVTDANAKQVALHITSGTQPTVWPEGHVSYLGQKGTVVFIGDNLDPLQPQKTYELWLIPGEKGAKPVPAGTFKPDANGRAHLVMASLPDVKDAEFGVTVEPEGGSNSPTGSIILLGE